MVESNEILFKFVFFFHSTTISNSASTFNGTQGWGQNIMNSEVAKGTVRLLAMS